MERGEIANGGQMSSEAHTNIKDKNTESNETLKDYHKPKADNDTNSAVNSADVPNTSEQSNDSVTNKLSETVSPDNAVSNTNVLTSSHSTEPSTSISNKCEKCAYETTDKVVFHLHVCKSKIREEGSAPKKINITFDGEVFLCGECGYTAQGHGFEEHLMCHLLLRPYQCIYCQESFINRKEIGKHVAVAHKGKKMNCALKAMKKAKAFMAETRKTGSYTFFARVSGRVPLGIVSKILDQTKSNDPKPNEKKLLSDDQNQTNKPGENFTNKETIIDNEKSLDKQTISDETANDKLIMPGDQIANDEMSIDKQIMPCDQTANDEMLTDKQIMPDDQTVHDEKSTDQLEKPDDTAADKETLVEKSVGLDIHSKGLNTKEPSCNIENEKVSNSEPAKNMQNCAVPVFQTSEACDEIRSIKEPEANPGTEDDAESNKMNQTVSITSDITTIDNSITCETNRNKKDSSIPKNSEDKNRISTSESIEEDSQSPEQSSIPVNSDIVNQGSCISETVLEYEKENTDSPEDSMSIMILESFSLNECPKKPEDSSGDTVGYQTPMEPDQPINETTHVAPTPLTPQKVLAAVRKQNRGPNFYACGFLCDFSCLNSIDFREHLQKEHYGSGTYPCSHCGWTTHNEEGLLKHVTVHAHAYNKTAPLYFCGVLRCRFGTNLLLEFINHMNILHPDLTKHNCKECGAAFDSLILLLQHFEDNYLHVVNCPHCSSKGRNRQIILKHISEIHPGKAKMVSVGKQIICKDRKVNSFHQLKGLISNMRRSRSSASNIEHILNLELPSLFSDTGPTISSNTSSNSINEPMIEQVPPQHDSEDDEANDDNTSKSDLYDDQLSTTSSADLPVPETLKHVDQNKCQFCTFVARDAVRLSGHQTCHTVGGDIRQQAKRQRFKCPYCPQCFENLVKFTAHVSCHPGLNKYCLLTCTNCDFNSNQKHNILKHIETKCGRNYLGFADDLFTEEERNIESRVLECENCNFQTRHKIHLKIHYETEHQAAYEDMYGKKAKNYGNDNTSMELDTGEMSVLRSPPSSASRENLSKKFMCPVCFYLLPKGADLKKHIRKHPELGKVSLVLFRCRYCSCASTAKHVIAGHIKDKHPGRDIALVKKIISVDTRDSDNSFSETQVSETPVNIPDSEVALMLAEGNASTQSVSTIIEQAVESNETYHHVFIVPEYSQGNFASAIQCPCCDFVSYAAAPLISHLKKEHPKLCVVGRQLKPTPKYYKLGTTIPFGLLTLLHSAVGLKQEAIVFSPKDVFSVSAQCPKCVFSTYFKQNFALHVRDHHRELSILEAQKDETKTEKKITTLDIPPLPPLPSSAEATLAKLQQLRKQDPIIVGSGILDDKLKGLYENLGFVSRCAICGTERPKRYHMHVHVLRHLNVSLWKCQYCEYKGLERYKMCKHIKDQHPQKKMAIKYLPVDIEEKIAEYLNERSLAASQGLETLAAKVSPGAKYSMDAAFSPLGNDDLDEHLKEMYREDGDIFYCILCSFTVRRKFAIHRHLVSSHLTIALVGCGYCGFRGIDRKSIIDHSHETHAQSTLNVILLPNDLKKIVTDCLSSSGLKDNDEDETVDASIPIAEPIVQFQQEQPRPKQKARKSCPTPKPARIEPEVPEVPAPQESTQEDASNNPDMKKYVMGTEMLDSKLRILFSTNYGKFQCNICESEFPRKYAIHRHLLMSHLKVGLMQCPLCPYSGVERYIVVNHLKEHHKVDNQIPYSIPVDMDANISEFLSQKLGSNRTYTQRRRKSKDSLIDYSSGSGTDGNGPMVVAMFNKRKSNVPRNEEPADEPIIKKIKQEVMDDESFTDPQEDEKSTESVEKTESSEFKPELNWETETGNDYKARSMIDVGTKIQVINLSNGYEKRFGCERCSFTSAHRSNVQRHVFRVHEKYRYKICKVCGYRTLSNVLIRQHIQEKHGDATESDIIYEKQTFERNTPTSTTRESPPTVQQGLYACAYCDFETNTSEEIVIHMEKDHPKTTGETEPTPSAPAKIPVLKIPSFQAKQHDFSSFKKKSLSCEYCDFQCSIYRLLKSHVALVHKDQPKAEESLIPRPSWKYACVECHLKMDAGTKMKCHIGRHFNYKPYVCETCGADFASPDEMRKHIRRYLHSEKINYVKQDDQEEKLEELLQQSKQYALDILEGKVPNINPNRIGQRIVKTKKPATPPQMDGSPAPNKKSKIDYNPNGTDLNITGGFGCSSCEFTSQSINDVSTHHMRTHRNKTFLWKDLVMGYMCDVNGHVVQSEKELPKKKSASFRTSHATKTPWHTCTKCGFNTSALQGMMGHIKAHGTRDYVCAYCSNRYFKRVMLSRHQKSIHKGKRMWIIHQTADEVESSVAADDNDVEPEPLSESNSGAKLSYCCHLCDFKADSLYQYRLHLPSHGQCDHLVPDIATESPLKCGYCAYVAVDQRDFSAHINIHLTDRAYKCYFCVYSSYNRKDVASHLSYTHSDKNIADENKYIISSKDATKLSTQESSTCELPMLANLDPRVVLKDKSISSEQALARPHISSLLDMSSAFELLETEADGNPLDDQLLEQTEEETELERSEGDEVSLTVDSDQLESLSDNGADFEESPIGDMETITLSNDIGSNFSDSVSELSSVMDTEGLPGSALNPDKTRSDAPSDVAVFDSIDKALEQLNRHNKNDNKRGGNSASNGRSSQNIFESFQ